MIEDLDADQLAGFGQPTGDLTIFQARRRVAAGMIVHQQHGGGRITNGRPKHLPRVHQAGIERADGDLVGRNRLVLGIKRDDVELLLDRVLR